MPSLGVSPQVIIREIDNSLYSPNLSPAVMGVVGVSQRGDLDTVIDLTSLEDLLTKLGNPESDYYGWFLAQQFLQRGSICKFVRVAADLAAPSLGSMTATKANGGSLTQPETFEYVVTFVLGYTDTDGTGEVESTAAASGPSDTTDASNQTIDLANIPLGPEGCVARNIYQKEGSGTFNFLAAIADNTTTVYSDDGSVTPNATKQPPTSAPKGASSAHVKKAATSIYAVTHNTGTKAFRVKGKTVGTYYNSWQLVVAAGSNGKSGSYKYTLKDGNGNVIEVYDNVTYNATDLTDDLLVRVADSSHIVVTKIVTTTLTNIDVGTYTLEGGADGDESLTDNDYTGNGNPDKGLELFTNIEEVDVHILAVPGVGTQSVHTALTNTATTRGDAIALLDPPSGKDVATIISDVRGASPTYGVNSSYSALYWPWLYFNDPFNNVKVNMPPSVFVARVLAFNDYVASTAQAPAGYNRGLIQGALGLELLGTGKARRSPNLGEREQLYANQINPIVNQSGVGLVVLGQKTMQTKPTALDRINVRRMLLDLKRAARRVLRYIKFEPADQVTWRTYQNLMQSSVDPFVLGRGLEKVKVVVDATTNPPAVRNNNEIRGKVILTPVKAGEIIVQDFIITESGASFDEVVLTT